MGQTKLLLKYSEALLGSVHYIPALGDDIGACDPARGIGHGAMYCHRGSPDHSGFVISVCDTGRCNQHLVVRLLCKDLSWAWVQIIASKEYEREKEIITCTNFSLRYNSLSFLGYSLRRYHLLLTCLRLSVLGT